jgi:ribonuclease P/MRP protein subunit RPP40
VVSGVPQGTVLGPLLFLCHINDLPDSVKSQVRLFADDCLLYRTIKNYKEHVILQQDLANLEIWAHNWGMEFNASKCYILSVRPKTTHYYQLNKIMLKEVPSSPYLGVLISSDLKWRPHINKIYKKAIYTLGFLRRNLRHSPSRMRKTAYVSLVRSTLEYGEHHMGPIPTK